MTDIYEKYESLRNSVKDFLWALDNEHFGPGAKEGLMIAGDESAFLQDLRDEVSK